MSLFKNYTTIFTVLLSLFIPSLSDATFNIAAEAHTKGVPELAIARNLGDNIAHIKRGGGTTLELALNDIMNDHTQSHHKANDSYFRTDSRDEVKQILNLVIANPDRYEIYQSGSRMRMNLRKTIAVDDVRRIMKHDNVGYDNSNNTYVNHVVLVFDITGINNLADSLKKGAFLTAFPTRENFHP
jgi:hypothetical protein